MAEKAQNITFDQHQDWRILSEFSARFLNLENRNPDTPDFGLFWVKVNKYSGKLVMHVMCLGIHSLKHLVQSRGSQGWNMSISIEAQCHCSNVRLEFIFQEIDLPLTAHICHCESCRRSYGTLGTFHAALPKGPKLAELNSLSKYASSANVVRYFCSICGAQVVDQTEENDSWVVATALFREPQSIYRYEYHMFIADTLDGGQSDWVNSIQGKPLTRWLEWPEKSPQAPNLWRDPQSRLTGINETNIARFAKLHCYCRCKGVEFQLLSAASLEHDFLSSTEPDIKRCIAEKEQKWRASNCVCNTCRTTSGAEITQWISVPQKAVTLVNNESLKSRDFGSLKEYRSSNRASRYFCSSCGACAFYYRDDQLLSVDVAFGLLHAKSGARAEEWVEWDRSIDWEKDGAGRGFVEGLREGLSRNLEQTSMIM